VACPVGVLRFTAIYKAQFPNVVHKTHRACWLCFIKYQFLTWLDVIFFNDECALDPLESARNLIKVLGFSVFGGMRQDCSPFLFQIIVRFDFLIMHENLKCIKVFEFLDI
jgi:hypothetical protein